MDVLKILAGQLILISATYGLDKDLSCAVCRAIVGEVDYVIAQIDPKKTIQVGSFRVDPKGNQRTYEVIEVPLDGVKAKRAPEWRVDTENLSEMPYSFRQSPGSFTCSKPYARSEVHLMEVFENVCENFKDYAETTDESGARSIGRTKARDGKTLALKGIKISADIQKQLKFKCESLVEEYEENMIALFGRDNSPDLEKVICGEVTSQCTGRQLQVPMPVTEYESTEDAMKSDGDKDGDKSEDNTETEDEELERLKEQYFKDNKSYDDIVAELEANTAKQTEKEEL